MWARLGVLILLPVVCLTSASQAAPTAQSVSWTGLSSPQNLLKSIQPEQDMTDKQNIILRRRRQILPPSTLVSDSPSSENFTEPLNPLPANPVATVAPISEFISRTEGLLRDLLVNTESAILRMIGEVDHGSHKLRQDLQEALLNSAQHATAGVSEALPKPLSELLQKFTNPNDPRVQKQLKEAWREFRRVRKMLKDSVTGYEKDAYNEIQHHFSRINEFLRVSELPKRGVGW